MSNITKFFQRGTKKRDLSDKYETGEDSKKVREGCLDCSQISQTSDIPDDVFTKNLDSPDCVVILFNCLKNLESKMKEISVSSKETTASQIKVEKQLSDLTDSVVEENRNEDTNILSSSIINEHLGLDIQPFDIDRMHRISNKNKARKKGRAIIITFTRYNTRKKVFMNKKQFKGTNISVTESLTSL